MKRLLWLLFPVLVFAASCTEETDEGLPKNDGDEQTAPPVVDDGDEQNTPSVEEITGNIESITFKKMDIQGAKTLALAPSGEGSKTATRADGDDVSNMPTILYIMEDDGTLREVEYTLEIKGEGAIVDTVTHHLKISINRVRPIGEKWLWLYDCRYYYPGIEEIPDSTKLFDSLNGIINDFNGSRHSFLVRRTDGALFAWDDPSNPSVSDVCFTDPMTINSGTIKSVGEDIFTSILPRNDGRGYKLYGIFDNGDMLDVKQMFNESVYLSTPEDFYPVPGQDALLIRPSHVDDYVVLFTKTSKMSLIKDDHRVEGEPPGWLVTDDDALYSISPYFSPDYAPSEYSLYTASSGKTVPLCGERFNAKKGFAGTTLDREETVFLKQKDEVGGLKAVDGDPMSFTVGEGDKGISLPPGSYDFVLEDDILYVDDVTARTHDKGPVKTIQRLNVDSQAQTASWDLHMAFASVYFCHYTVGIAENHCLKWFSINRQHIFIGKLDLLHRRYEGYVRTLPENFPTDPGVYIDGIGYALKDNNAFYVCSTETWESELVPIDYSSLQVNLVGRLEYFILPEEKVFEGHGMTLEGTYVTIYVDLVGENRGVARVFTTESHGAGETIAQLIRLN